MATWEVLPHTEYGGVTVEFYRDDGQTLLPEWTINPRLNKTPIPGAGEYVQQNGFDRDSLTVIADVISDTDARALRALVGTPNTLRLKSGIGSLRGSSGGYYPQVDTAYEDFSDVTLASLEPLGMRRSGRFRYRATFERAHS